jgi:bacterial/archaeal transporter family protein
MSWIVFASLSAVFAAFTAILTKIGVKDINSNLATAIRTVVVVVFAWVIVLAQGTYKDIPSIPRHTMLFLVLSGIATGLSWLFYFRALQLGNASQVQPIDKFSLVLVIIFASVFLGEKLTFPVIIGTVFITIGTLIIAIMK